MTIREILYQFIETRLQQKLEKAKPEQIEEIKKYYQMENWIADAARRAKQIKFATHIAKGIHPESKAININAKLSPLPEGLIGSGSLGNLEVDVVGNAAALDVYKFLNLPIDHETCLYDLVMAEDPRLLVIFSDDSEKSLNYIQAFKEIALRVEPDIYAHELTKQVLWPIGHDAQKTDTYLNLVPLYPTSLVHHVYQVLQKLRYGDDAKEAKLAKSNKSYHPSGYAYFPDIAYLKFGGTKPQNISQKNSERGGRSYLLASLPPKQKISVSLLEIFKSSVSKPSVIREEVF